MFDCGVFFSIFGVLYGFFGSNVKRLDLIGEKSLWDSSLYWFGGVFGVSEGVC